jgi:hypothetical protein
MAKLKKEKNDKFYTKASIVNNIINKIDLNAFDLIIEPSAGDGAFSRNIKHNNIISLDIEPEYSGIIKQDWFLFELPTEYQNIIVIGNPPFGNQGSLAFNFIKKAATINAAVIAFILPKSFKKKTYKNKIPRAYHLTHEEDLDDNCFLLNGQDYIVPCVFQIWTRKDTERELYKMKTTSDYIQFVKKDESPDYAFRRVGFYAGKIYDSIDDKSEQSHYFIKSSDAVKYILKYKIWEHNNTVGPKSIGKSEIIEYIESCKIF